MQFSNEWRSYQQFGRRSSIPSIKSDDVWTSIFSPSASVYPAATCGVGFVLVS